MSKERTQQMKLDFALESEKSTLGQQVEAFELSDEELAEVVGGDRCCGDRFGRHEFRFRFRQQRCRRWDRRGRCREWGWY
jgi:bacteriocin-like protein